MFGLKNMMSVSIINVCCIILGISMSICYGSRVNETQYNNCITWRDNLSTVILTCKVANSNLPVTFYHNGSNTRVECEIDGKNKHCLPRGKRTRINKYDHTVKIELYEQKIGKNLDGRWHCIQGGRSQTTNVSVSKGIIIDSWIQLRGKTILNNGTKYIDLECSSCRKPQGLYAEYLVNDVTAGSIRLDEEGNCVHKNANCSIDKCNCSSTANMFIFRLKVKDLHNEAKFSCDMQFTDLLRKGRFSMTASQIYKGKDFSVTEYKTVILKPNIAFIDGNIEKTTNRTVVLGDHHLEIILPVVIFIVGILTTAIFIVYRHNLIKKKDKVVVSANDKSEQVESELKPLLKDTAKNNQCKSCGTYIKVEYMCLDCRQLFCERCIKQYHDINEETKQHKPVNIEKIPEHFSVTMFNCSLDDHEHSLLQYTCYDHNDLICEHCKSQKHSSCYTQLISEILPEETTEIMYAFQCKIDDTEAQILALRNFVKRNAILYKRQVSTVQQHIDHSDETTFQIGKETNTLTKCQTIKGLSEMEINFQNEVEQICMRSEELHNVVKTQRKLCEFVLEFGGNLHVFASVILLDKTLNEIISELTEGEIYYKRTNIILLNGKNIIIHEVPLSECSSRQSGQL